MTESKPVGEIATLIAELEIDEKIALLSGSDIWRTAAVPRLGIGTVKVTDGPNGARGDSTTGAKAVCLPASIGMASTFDTDLVLEIGRLLGRETARKGADVLLAPTINMARHPLGGRNFESFGEDPQLTADMAVAYIAGVQDEGVGACAKHFVANDVEDDRLTVSSEVDARTLREVYLRPFEAAVEAGVWTIMAAYPKLNGVHCTEHDWLLTSLLRDEWGFDGLVMSDWGATHHPTRPIDAGMDLEMPGPPLVFGAKLRSAFDQEEISEAVIDARVRRILELAKRAGRTIAVADAIAGGRVEDEPVERSVDLPDEQALARRLAADSMVLLRNDQATLPLDGVASVALIGPNADPGVIQGGGSAQLPAHHITSPLAGLQEAFGDAAVDHHVGCLAHRYLPDVEPESWEGSERPLNLEIFASTDLSGEPAITRTARSATVMIAGGMDELPNPMQWSQRWTGQLRIEQSGTHRFGVMAVGPSRVLIDGVEVVDNWTAMTPGDAFFQRASAEVVGAVDLEAGSVVEVVIEWSRGNDEFLAGLRFGYLPPTDEDQLLSEAAEAASAADAAVVVVGLDALWETESHDRPMFGLPGRQDELVRRVVAANPRTVVVVNAGGPVDLPWLDDVPASLMAWYPGQEFGGALTDVLTGAADPGGRLPVTFPVTTEQTPTAGFVPGDGDLLVYGEQSHVGYRWYDREEVEPRRPFGHGGSYASFEIGTPTVVELGSSGGPVEVEVPVKNTSGRSGKCVVQIYVEPPAGDDRRPLRLLGGFGVARLGAGEETTLKVSVAGRSFEVWGDDGWVVPAGEYGIAVGTSSRELPHRLTVVR